MSKVSTTSLLFYVFLWLVTCVVVVFFASGEFTSVQARRRLLPLRETYKAVGIYEYMTLKPIYCLFRFHVRAVETMMETLFIL